jgi:Tfp pilus assembly protein PilZ
MTRVYAERKDRAQLFSVFSAILRHGTRSIPTRPVYFTGLIALLVGLALLSYSYILAPKE